MLILYLILIFITDNSKQPLHGVKVELVGTNKVYYTNVKGQVIVPSNFDLKMDYISYKTKTVSKDSLNYPIVLQSR